MVKRGSAAFNNPWNPMGAAPEGITLKDYLPEDNLELLHPFWYDFPPEHPMVYMGIAFIYIVLGILSIGGNFLVLYVFMKFRALRTPSNLLVINLSVADVGSMIIMVPQCMYSFMMGGIWQFGDVGCQLHSFFGSLCGVAQITSLVFISYDRFNVVVRGMAAKPLTYGRVALVITCIWIYGACWATGPLLGFGSYAMDGIVASCSYGYMDQSFTNVAYILAQFGCCYVFSLLVISICYFHIVKAVFQHEKAMREQAKKMNVASLKTNEDADKQSTEIKIAKVALINVSLWILAWTPFAVVCLTGVLSDQTNLTPLITSVPSLLAKTACVYNPIIYSLSHPRYRKCLKQAFPWFCINLGPDSGSVASGTSSAMSTTKPAA